jgi:hypothetical protein
MDEVQNHLARELADAVAAAVAQSVDVEACREKAREAGYHLKVTLEATVGFAVLPEHEAGTGARDEADAEADTEAEAAMADEEPSAFAVSANDRRFLRSLRIAADEVKVEEAN